MLNAMQKILVESAIENFGTGEQQNLLSAKSKNQDAFYAYAIVYVYLGTPFDKVDNAGLANGIKDISGKEKAFGDTLLKSFCFKILGANYFSSSNHTLDTESLKKTLASIMFEYMHEDDATDCVAHDLCAIAQKQMNSMNKDDIATITSAYLASN